MKRSAFYNDDPHRDASALQREIAQAEEFNPWRALDFGDKGSDTTIETPERVQNVRWQMRSRAPTEYEHRLAETLGELYSAGVWELKDIVAGLNESGLRTPADEAWTEANFEPELTKLEASL